MTKNEERKNYGTAGMMVEFDTSGLENLEKLLFSIEPAVVNAEIEYLKAAAKQIIALIRDNLPPNFVELRKSIMGIIEVYGGGQKIFLSVGVGGEGATKKEREDLPLDHPYRFARWQEHGWEPVRWEARRQSGWEKKRKRFKRKKMAFSAEEESQYQNEVASLTRSMERAIRAGWMKTLPYHKKKGNNKDAKQLLYGSTIPKHFIKQSKAEGRELAQKALDDAIAKVTEMFDSGEIERMVPQSNTNILAWAAQQEYGDNGRIEVYL